MFFKNIFNSLFQEYLQPVDSLDSMASSVIETTEEGDEEEEEGKKERENEVVARSLEQREYRIRELVESERDYVTDLAQCVQYIKFMRYVSHLFFKNKNT